MRAAKEAVPDKVVNKKAPLAEGASGTRRHSFRVMLRVKRFRRQEKSDRACSKAPPLKRRRQKKHLPLKVRLFRMPKMKVKHTFLPGSTLSIALLTGVNAPTNTNSDSKDPLPVLMQVKGTAILPNGFRSDLSDCFVLASTFGQYMDSRAMMRTKTLSCIRSDGKAVEAEISGTVYGEDGKPGFQGRLVPKPVRLFHNCSRSEQWKLSPIPRQVLPTA